MFPRLDCKGKSDALDKEKWHFNQRHWFGSLCLLWASVWHQDTSHHPCHSLQLLAWGSHGRQDREELSQQSSAGSSMTGSVTQSSFSHSCVSWSFSLNPKCWNFWWVFFFSLYSDRFFSFFHDFWSLSGAVSLLSSVLLVQPSHAQILLNCHSFTKGKCLTVLIMSSFCHLECQHLWMNF